MSAAKLTALRIPADRLAVIDQNAKAAGMNRTQWMIEASMHWQQPENELEAIKRRLDRLEQIAGMD